MARLAVLLAAATWACGVGSLLAAGPPDASTSVEWGWWLYTAGTETYSDNNMVIGGPVGSAMLVCRNLQRGHTDWVLVDGEALLMNRVGNPPERAVKVRGNYVRTWPGTTWSKEKPYNAAVLSEALQDLYFRSRSARPPIRHVPFLVGEGWAGNVGAYLNQQAAPLLASMDLAFAIDANSPNKGRVTKQVPAGGTVAGYKAVVTVTLDGSDEPLADQLPVGDEPNSAIAVNAAGPASVTLDPNYSNSVVLTCGDRPRRDAFFKVATPTARQFTVQQADDPNQSHRLLLAAYQRTPPNGPMVQVSCATCCVAAEWPELKFTATPGSEYFVVVQVMDTTLNPKVTLDFQWTEMMAPMKGEKGK